MKGSVTKYTIKGSSRPRWRYRVYVGKNSDGKDVYVGSGGFEKQGEAEDAARKHIERLANPQGTALHASETAGKETPTLAVWLKHWLDTFAVDRCQPKTLERYRQLSGYVSDGPAEELTQIAARPISMLRRSELRSAFFALLRAKGKRREHVSARTVRHVAGVVSVALNEAVEQELIPSNPMLRLKLPATETGNARSLTPSEIQALRGACRNDWTFVLVEIALASGARRGELLALQWGDIDWATRSIAISKSLEQTSNGLRVKTTKSKKLRRFKLPQAAITALQFLRDQQVEQRRLFGRDYRNNDLVFSQPDGSFCEPDLVSQVIVRRMRKAGIKDASFHTLRHSHASNLLSRGVPLPVVSERLGHSDSSVTARIYAHAIPADDQRAADEWDGIVGPVQ